jgi:GTP pyrophosphokinase
MHNAAEYGIAAHWLYKEKGNSEQVSDLKEYNKMNWLKDILDVNNNETNSLEFLKFVKSDFDLFTEKVYCFTPNGDAITLPYGSTPIDFAYMIYSAIGNKMVGAKVNIVLVTIDYKIKNGDRISIITSGNSNGPSRDWLSIIKSPQARTKILHWFKQEGRDKIIALG